jgi:hypothetical protein
MSEDLGSKQHAGCCGLCQMHTPAAAPHKLADPHECCIEAHADGCGAFLLQCCPRSYVAGWCPGSQRGGRQRKQAQASMQQHIFTPPHSCC